MKSNRLFDALTREVSKAEAVELFAPLEPFCKAIDEGVWVPPPASKLADYARSFQLVFRELYRARVNDVIPVSLMEINRFSLPGDLAKQYGSTFGIVLDENKLNRFESVPDVGLDVVSPQYRRWRKPIERHLVVPLLNVINDMFHGGRGMDDRMDQGVETLLIDTVRNHILGRLHNEVFERQSMRVLLIRSLFPFLPIHYYHGNLYILTA